VACSRVNFTFTLHSNQKQYQPTQQNKQLHYVHISEFVSYIQNNIITHSNICDVEICGSHIWMGKDESPGTRQCGDWKIVTDCLTEDHTTMHVLKPFLGPWRWRQETPLKQWHLCTYLHEVFSQKTCLFKICGIHNGTVPTVL